MMNKMLNVIDSYLEEEVHPEQRLLWKLFRPIFRPSFWSEQKPEWRIRPEEFPDSGTPSGLDRSVNKQGWLQFGWKV